MKRVFRIITITVILVFVFVFGGNSAIRVSNGSGESIGIFEKILLGRSLFSLLQPLLSENYKRWNAASEGSKTVADIIAKYGDRLVTDKNLESTRLKATEISDSAYLNAKNIDLEYLRKSNQDLPEMFSTNLTIALKLWSEGLKEKDNSKIIAGNKFYNEFVQWMQSKKRSDFNGIR